MAPAYPDAAPRALRLALALDAGLTLPDGRVALLHPGGTEALPDLPVDRLLAVTPHAPDFAMLAAQGVAVQAADPAPGSMGAVVVCLPRSRAEGMDLIARACALTSGPVIVDGQKTDGIEAVLRALKDRVDLSEPISKGHGKIAWFNAVPLEDWRAPPLRVTAPDGRDFATLAGVFSAERVDPASALLAEAVPEGVKGVAVDLGAGWGYLSARLLARAPNLREMHLIEADARALACARANVTDPRAQFHWADATQPRRGLRADLVVMNPPFHQGRAAQPALGAAFIGAAAAMLSPSGTLWMVANRHLPYEGTLAAAFREVEELAGTPAFKLFRAFGPRSAARPAWTPTRPRRSRA
jgi:16S rRNA (guanine1207-N2)-methyltransferase